jgi:hypothetical protein
MRNFGKCRCRRRTNRLRELVQEEQEERAGFIRPKRQREAMQRPLLEHMETFIAER